MGYLFTAGKGKSTTQKCRLAGDMLVLKKLITHQPGHHCIIDSSRDFPHVVRQPRSARSAHGTRFPLNSQNNGTWRHRKTSKTPWNNCGIQFRDDQISSKIMMISNSSPLETAKWAPNCLQHVFVKPHICNSSHVDTYESYKSHMNCHQD